MKQKQKADRISIRIAKTALPNRGKKASPSEKKRPRDHFKRLCWGLVPIATAVLLVLDAVGIYIFNTERLLVLGILLLSSLLPFLSEITIKDLTLRRDKPEQ